MFSEATSLFPSCSFNNDELTHMTYTGTNGSTPFCRKFKTLLTDEGCCFNYDLGNLENAYKVILQSFVCIIEYIIRYVLDWVDGWQQKKLYFINPPKARRASICSWHQCFPLRTVYVKWTTLEEIGWRLKSQQNKNFWLLCSKRRLCQRCLAYLMHSSLRRERVRGLIDDINVL